MNLVDPKTGQLMQGPEDDPLQQALMNRQMQEQNLLSRAMQTKRAEALRDQKGSKGYGALGDVMANWAGDRKLDKIEAKNQQDRQGLGKSLGLQAVEAHRAAMVAEDDTRRGTQVAEQNADSNTQNADSNTLNAATNARGQDERNRAGAHTRSVYGQGNASELSGVYTFKDENGDEQTINVDTDNKGQPVKAGSREPILSFDNMTKVADDAYRGGKHWGEESITKLGAGVSQIKGMNELVRNFTDNMAQVPVPGKWGKVAEAVLPESISKHLVEGGIPSRVLNETLGNLSQNDLLKFADEATNEQVKEQIRRIADWRMIFTLGTRNEMFGSALTEQEKKSWDQAEAITLGMDPKEMQLRMARLSQIVERKMFEKLNLAVVGVPKDQQEMIIRAGAGSPGADDGLYEFNPKTNTFIMPDRLKEDMDYITGESLHYDQQHAVASDKHDAGNSKRLIKAGEQEAARGEAAMQEWQAGKVLTKAQAEAERKLKQQYTDHSLGRR
ncbi:hypothetical protein N9937_01320 [bacterium]|nr:hypothetical protein [bacterium]